jgi:hypothetical protein
MLVVTIVGYYEYFANILIGAGPLVPRDFFGEGFALMSYWALLIPSLFICLGLRFAMWRQSKGDGLLIKHD